MYALVMKFYKYSMTMRQLRTEVCANREIHSQASMVRNDTIAMNYESLKASAQWLIMVRTKTKFLRVFAVRWCLFDPPCN